MTGRSVLIFAVLVFVASLPAASCLPITDAGKHIGATKCVSGKVLRVKQGERGVHFFDFCEDYRTCPFSVVVFSRDLKQIGDLRRLEGHQIEIDGEIKSYDGRAEIILSRASQLRGDAAHIPPLPKDYDVERHGQIQRRPIPIPQESESAPRKKGSPPVTLEDPSLAESPSD